MIPLPLARRWARDIRDHIEDECERVEIVGSIRRGQEQVGDLELLVAPVMRVEQGDLFSAGPRPDTQAVVDAILEQDRERIVAKGGDRYVQIILSGKAKKEDRPKLDLFFCHPPASWGALKTIRTGPSDLGRIIVTELRERGWRMKDGAVWKPTTLPDGSSEGGMVRQFEDGSYQRIPTPEEEDVFEAVGLEYVPPERRDELAQRLQRRRTG